MTDIRLSDDVRAVLEDVVALRHDLHAHPELAFCEKRTSAVVAERLRGLGLEPTTGIAQTGVTAVIEGQAGDGPTVLLRADMDALPIHEANEHLPYRSRHDGVMHACGHDGHTAILAGVAEVLQRRRARLRGRVKLCFQPAEESQGGAKPMIEAGVLRDPDVDYAFGLHLWAPEPTGTVGVAAGPVMAKADTLEITIRGRGGHAAMPSEAVDPIVAGAQIVGALQTLVSRNVSPFDQAVISICTFAAGHAFNVIPEQALLRGTVRTFEPRVQELLERRIREVCEQLAAGLGAVAEVDYRHGYPATVNDPACAELVREAAMEVVGEERLFQVRPVMGGEDFAYYLQEVPGCFFMIGIQNAEKGTGAPHHNPHFNVDDDALGVGIETMLHVVEKVTSG